MDPLSVNGQGRTPPELLHGRVTAAHVGIAFRRGIAFASVYGEVGTGLKGDNLLLQDILEEHIRRLSCLWAIGCDFNIEPQALQEFAARIGGVLV